MEFKNKIENQTFEEERALYHLQDTEVKNCTFAGKLDRRICTKRNKKYKSSQL